MLQYPDGQLVPDGDVHRNQRRGARVQFGLRARVGVVSDEQQCLMEGFEVDIALTKESTLTYYLLMGLRYRYTLSVVQSIKQ